MRTNTVSFFAVAVAASLALPLFAQTISVPDNFARLTAQEDTDGDHKITVHDRVTPFEITGTNGVGVKSIDRVYSLSVLLQELKRDEDERRFNVTLRDLPLDEPVVERTHRLIREYYWDALTRRIDAAHLDRVAPDSKVQSDADYLYVPASDPEAVNYFQAAGKAEDRAGHFPPLKVVVLPSPEKFTADFVRNLDGRHGLLSLALETNADGTIAGVPYVVPGGRFNELYCWDSYFITLGLLHDGRNDLARGMADNLMYEANHYGKIPNANRTYYLTRSQPPFLTSIIRAVYQTGTVNQAWLTNALKTAIAEYENVWMSPERTVRVGTHSLNRYWAAGEGPCPEVEPGHYDQKIAPWLAEANAARTGPPLTPYRFLNEFLYCGQDSELTVDEMTLSQFFKNDRALRESGHDTTHRFDDRTTDFVSVDLNSLLYRYEMDFAEILQTQFGGALPVLGREFGDATYWRQRAARRKAAMMDLLWDPGRGFFFDYDFVNHRRSDYISATGLYPLWAKLLDRDDPAEMEDARRVAAIARAKLEQRFGLAASAAESVAAARTHDARQWDYPYGWAPHQMLAWQGFRNYGFEAEADRLAYRWLYAIAKNAHDYNGVIPEKYNVVTGSHDVFVEYGNVGTKFDYIAPEGFGWMNASFQVGPDYLTPASRADLAALKPPK